MHLARPLSGRVPRGPRLEVGVRVRTRQRARLPAHLVHSDIQRLGAGVPESNGGSARLGRDASRVQLAVEGPADLDVHAQMNVHPRWALRGIVRAALKCFQALPFR